MASNIICLSRGDQVTRRLREFPRIKQSQRATPGTNLQNLGSQARVPQIEVILMVTKALGRFMRRSEEKSQQ